MFSPTAPDAATVAAAQPVTVTITTAEHVTINGLGGNDGTPVIDANSRFVRWETTVVADGAYHIQAWGAASPCNEVMDYDLYIDGDGRTGTDIYQGTVSCSTGSNPHAITGPTRFKEVIVCTAQLSGTDREKLEGYLAHKHGLAGNLPGGHPYLSAPP